MKPCHVCVNIEDELAASGCERAIVVARRTNRDLSVAVDMAIDEERERRDYWKSRALTAEAALKIARSPLDEEPHS